MLNSQAKGSSMNTPRIAITTRMPRSTQRIAALVCICSVAHQAPRGEKLDRGDHKNDQRHHDRDGGGVADLETAECLLDNVDRHRAGGVAGTALRQDVDRLVYLQRADRGV